MSGTTEIKMWVVEIAQSGLGAKHGGKLTFEVGCTEAGGEGRRSHVQEL